MDFDPNLSKISELLKRLKVTKQSLNRVIKELKNFEIIEFKKGEKDTRLKHVFLTKKGYKIFDEIFSSQKKNLIKVSFQD